MESMAAEGELQEAAKRPKSGMKDRPGLKRDNISLFRTVSLERIDGTGGTQNLAAKPSDLW